MLGRVKEPICPFAPPHAVCPRAKTPYPGEPDGRLDKPFWEDACVLTDFHDIEGDSMPRPLKPTQVRMKWDDTALYIGAKLIDTTIWATVTERDAVVYADNDFEVFLDPCQTSHRYYELEMNAANTVWDLMMEKPARDDVRRIVSWDIHGLKSAVHIEGTLNGPQDHNKFWSVELIIPWYSLRECPSGECQPTQLAPMVGDMWRLNFSRVEYRVDEANRKIINPETGSPYPEYNWVWAPTGVIDIHMPEMWGYLLFAESAADPFTPPADEQARWELRKLYYRQRNYGQNHGAYTTDFAALAGKDTWHIRPELYVTPNMFEIIAGDLHIRQDGYMWKE